MTPLIRESVMLPGMNFLFRILCLWGLALMADHKLGAVELMVETDRSYYIEGTDNTVFVQATVSAPPVSGDTPPARRNLGLVVDRSGSMTGPLIQALRQSVINALEQLSPDDVISLVAFGSEVETVLEAQPRSHIQRIAQTVNRIEPAGGTALYDALNQAAAQVRRNASADSIDHLLVICDGKPNKGPREPEDFARLAELFASEGITVSTIGLGPDFDEDLLADLARLGRGRFHYASDGSSLDTAISADFGNFQFLIGHDAVLKLNFSTRSRKIESLGWNQGIVDEHSITWNLPYLTSGQTNVLTAEVEVQSYQSHISISDFASASLEWTDVNGERQSVETSAVSISFSTSPKAGDLTLNRKVFKTAVNHLVTEAMQEAIELIDEGKFDRARKVLERVRGRVVWVNNDIDEPEIIEQVQLLTAYLEEVRARGLNQVDRKILRSGLFNRFNPPMADDKEEKN